MFTVRRDELTFEVVEGGQGEQCALLLHGFPEDATCWDAVSPLLHAGGLRTLAPHQRGYSPGARPRAASAYTLDRLAGDALAVLDAAGVPRAHVVGHDWGGGVAWHLAQHHPNRVASLTVLSTPHPAAMTWAAQHADQRRRSWYMVAFQLPWLPERVLRAGFVRGLVRDGLPRAAAERYAARFPRAADLTGPINWYRALPRKSVLRWQQVTVPTTYVWGSADRYLGRAAAERTAHWVEGDYRFVELDAGHWLPENEPEAVAREILARSH